VRGYEAIGVYCTAGSDWQSGRPSKGHTEFYIQAPFGLLLWICIEWDLQQAGAVDVPSHLG